MSKLRDALKNDTVKSVLFLVIVLVSVVAFWFGLRAYLQTDSPLLAVASGSMEPTLYKGHLIVVQGVSNACELNVGKYGSANQGDIIVFHRPDTPSELIVHRAIDKYEKGGSWYIVTRGDANPSNDSWGGNDLHESYIVGKVVWSVPYLGEIPLFVHTPTGTYVIALLIIVILVLEFVVPVVRERMTPKIPQEETAPSETGSSVDKPDTTET